MTEERQAPILTQIQTELKAPKGQYNSFGKYKYRSAEDILEAVKPLLFKHEAQLTISDSPIQVGDRIYIKATAYYKDSEQEKQVEGYAREPISKKGMDDSQITGTASSYARKYALNGLFLIDDQKDADTDQYQRQTRNANNNSNNDQSNKTTEISRANRMRKKISAAKKFEVQYGGGKEKLVDVVSWEKSGDKQAHVFIETWTKRDPKNLAAYEFIETNGLYTVEKKEA